MTRAPGIRRLRSLLAGLLLLARPGWAEAPPRVLPSHDVAIVYDVSGVATEAIPGLAPSAGQHLMLRLAWDAAGQRLRIGADEQPQIAIVDLSARRASIVDPALHSALVLPVRAEDIAALTLSRARFVRHGRDAVLGRACTLWAVRAARGSGTVCLTEDGVMLRGDGDVDGRPGAFVARSISYAPQSAELFTVPSEYYRLEIPRFGRMD